MENSAINSAIQERRNKSAAKPPLAQDGRIAVLDGVRGLAIAMVMLYHMTIVGPNSWVEGALYYPIRDFGWCGVDLFFVLSGFLITGLLWDAKTEANYFRNFYARRVLRIFPLYYGYLAALFLVAPHFTSPQTAEKLGQHSIWYWAYLQNFALAGGGKWADSQLLNHLWSLAIEEQFYLVWPWVVLACSRRALILLCAATACLSLALRVALALHGIAPLAIYVVTPARLDPLALGGLIAMVARSEGGLWRFFRPAKWLTLASGVAIAGLAFWQSGFGYSLPLTVTIGLSLVAALFAAILVVAVTDPPASWTHRFFASRFLRMLGKYSYALYIFHQPVIMVATRLLESKFPRLTELQEQICLYALASAGSLVLAVVSWYLYEQPFLRLKRHFSTRGGSSGRVTGAI